MYLYIFVRIYKCGIHTNIEVYLRTNQRAAQKHLGGWKALSGLGAAGLPESQLLRPADKPLLFYWPSIKQETKNLT